MLTRNSKLENGAVKALKCQRCQKLGATVHALTVPLVTAADGTKFGKSTGGGSLWLDPEMTSPYSWYQYFVNTADADVIRYLRWFTFLPAEDLAELEEAEESAAGSHAMPRGQLTLTAPVLFGELFVTPLMVGFLEQHPAEQIRALLVDRVVSMVDEGIDAFYECMAHAFLHR